MDSAGICKKESQSTVFSGENNIYSKSCNQHATDYSTCKVYTQCSFSKHFYYSKTLLLLEAADEF